LTATFLAPLSTVIDDMGGLKFTALSDSIVSYLKECEKVFEPYRNNYAFAGNFEDVWVALL
jgi:hypothetical protein